MTSGPLRLHLETHHNTFRSFILVDADVEEGKGCTFKVRRDIDVESWSFPVPNCLWGGCDPYDLQRHFWLW